jgi:hypothetical protein
VKPTGAPRFTRYEVLGFGVANGAPAVRIDRMGPDNYWFGARPHISLERRGPGVDAMIEQVRLAAANYPYPNTYRPWPGPNSNAFLAHIARQVPELVIQLPSNAVGKDFLPSGRLFATAPSESGFQASLYGLAGILLAGREGLEVNLLGLSLGVDRIRLAAMAGAANTWITASGVVAGSGERPVGSRRAWCHGTPARGSGRQKLTSIGARYSPSRSNAAPHTR